MGAQTEARVEVGGRKEPAESQTPKLSPEAGLRQEGRLGKGLARWAGLRTHPEELSSDTVCT